MKYFLLLLPLALVSCETTDANRPSFTFGLSGTTASGQDYVIGLNVPLPVLKKKPVEPPLPTGDGSGKTPVLVSAQ